MQTAWKLLNTEASICFFFNVSVPWELNQPEDSYSESWGLDCAGLQRPLRMVLEENTAEHRGAGQREIQTMF